TGAGAQSGSLVYLGTSTLTLSGAISDYTGNTTIGNGTTASTLVIGSNNALGATTIGTTVTAGATLGVTGSITCPERITLTGTGVGGNGVLLNVSGANTLSGTITLVSPPLINVAGLSTLTISGNIAQASPGQSLTKSGPGMLLLSGSNTFTGNVTVNAGTLSH